MVAKIKWWEPLLGEHEKKYLDTVFENNFPNEGPLTTKFESKIAALLGAKHAVATTSGTAAIFLSLKAVGVSIGDEVIVPDMTFIATANAVEMCGAKVVLVDVDLATLNMDPHAFEKAISKKTKAVVPVHVTGRSCDMDAIMQIARKHKIHVVEDAAEGFLSKYKGKYLGTFGEAGCFSFSPNKTITTGQGGIIVTNDDTLHVRLRELKDQGRPVRGTGGDDRHDAIGYNFKFTDLQAAVGLGQLHYLQQRIGRMKRNHWLYSQEISDVPGLTLLPFTEEEVPQWTDVLLEDRQGLLEEFKKHNIDFRKFWFPIHSQTPFKDDDSKFPNSTRASPKALWLASAFTLKDEDIFFVCRIIKNFLTKKSEK